MLRMLKVGMALVACGGFTGLTAHAVGPASIDILGRGDSNLDGVVNVTDVIHMNAYLYSGGPAPPCLNTADVNADGLVNNSDPIFLLNYLYNGGSAPPWPGPFNQSCVASPYPTPGSCNAGC